MFRQPVDRAFKDIIRTVEAPDSARGRRGGLLVEGGRWEGGGVVAPWKESRASGRCGAGRGIPPYACAIR